MNQTEIEHALRSALAAHQAGDLAGAESIYRQILNAQPAQADALHLLGLIAHQSGRQAQAIQLIGRAVAQKPNWPEAVFHLGLAL